MKRQSSFISCQVALVTAMFLVNQALLKAGGKSEAWLLSINRPARMLFVKLVIIWVHLRSVFAAVKLDSCGNEATFGTAVLPIVRIVANTLAPINVIEWNSSGPVISISGPAPYMIDLVAQRAGFKYCWVPLGRQLLIGPTNYASSKSMVDYLLDGEGDLLLSAMILTTERYRLIDFTFPTAEGPFSVLIPFPVKTVNRSAISQPFDSLMWASIFTTLVVVVISLHFSSDRQKKFFVSFSYVISVLLGQGSYLASKKFTIRIIAGVWCLTAFILASAYSGNLLSFVMAPITRPLVDSFEDIPKIPGLKVAVDLGLAADFTISREKIETATSLGKAFAAVQKSLFRCNVTSRCLDKVLNDKYVYVHGKLAVDQAIIDDFRSTGECRFSVATNEFLSGYLVWGTPKKSIYRRNINNGILELDAFGLSRFWKAKFTKKAKACTDFRNNAIRLSRLSFSQLSSMFALLGIGYSLAFLTFIVEKFPASLKIRSIIKSHH